MRKKMNLKSYPQLKAIHKLIKMIDEGYFAKKKKRLGLENIKREIKIQAGFIRPPSAMEIKRKVRLAGIKEEDYPIEDWLKIVDVIAMIKEPRSFEFATKEEMIDIITCAEAWAATDLKLEGIYLNSQEKQEMIKHYEKQ
jgi:hypothetical protein